MVGADGSDDGAGGVSADEVTGRPSARRRLVSAVLVLVAVAGFGWALAGRWAEIADRLGDQRPLVLIGSLALALSGVFMSFLLWRGTLRALGSDLPVRPAARLFFVTQLGKYLPGAVWPVVAQMRTGRELACRGSGWRSPSCSPSAWPRWSASCWGSRRSRRWWTGGAPGSCSVCSPCRCSRRCSSPRVLNSVLAALLRGPAAAGAGRAGGRSRHGARRRVGAGVWLVYGGHVWLLAAGLGRRPGGRVAGGDRRLRIAFSLGPLLVVLPAGAGVREAVLVVLLSSVLPDAGGHRRRAHARAACSMATDGLLAVGAVLLPQRP